MDKTANNIKKLYRVRQEEKIIPRYIVQYEVDINDADYRSGDIKFSIPRWNERPNFFFLMIAYLGKGHKGRFSHGEEWGAYYGNAWQYNNHGFADMIDDFAGAYGIGFCNNNGEREYSYHKFIIYFYDEHNTQFNVEIPDIDSLFDTEEEMIAAMTEAYEEWKKTDDAKLGNIYTGDDYFLK